ncbi:MAG: response regulator [Deltaproteobacteria bacterium]|nr:response regulator [Deltaproteobacteria bacterium]
MSDKPIIVCVDDEEDMLATVARCLRKEPYDVRTTTSALEALGWIESNEVAVLISDYDMPEMTGAQLAGHVRRLRPETIRILLTGRRTLDTAIDGINQGEIFRFIAKPFENEDLRRCVAAAVARHEEMIALSGDRQRRERREAVRVALEFEYPGIGQVTRTDDGAYEVAAEALKAAEALGIDLTTKLA